MEEICLEICAALLSRNNQDNLDSCCSSTSGIDTLIIRHPVEKRNNLAKWINGQRIGGLNMLGTRVAPLAVEI
jgi:hypothetical protein